MSLFPADRAPAQLRPPPPPLPRTNRTSLVPPLVLIGHATSLDRSNFDSYTADLERLWQDGTPPEMAKRDRAVATRRPGEPKSRRREKDVTLCPTPLDALSYQISPRVALHIARGHAEEARFFTKAFPRLPTAAWPLAQPGHRLRVAYVSIELRDRPVGKDMVQVRPFPRTPLRSPGKHTFEAGTG